MTRYLFVLSITILALAPHFASFPTFMLIALSITTVTLGTVVAWESHQNHIAASKAIADARTALAHANAARQIADQAVETCQIARATLALARQDA